jgi:hypothetical protein
MKIDRRQALGGLSAAAALASAKPAFASVGSTLPITWVGRAKESLFAPVAIDYVERALKDRKVLFRSGTSFDHWALLEQPRFEIKPGRVWDTHSGWRLGTESEGVEIHITDGDIQLKATSCAHILLPSPLSMDASSSVTQIMFIRSPHVPYREHHETGFVGYNDWPEGREDLDLGWLKAAIA